MDVGLDSPEGDSPSSSEGISQTGPVDGTDQNQNQCAVTPDCSGGGDSPKKARFVVGPDTESEGDKEMVKMNGDSKDETPPSDEELLRRLEEANRMLEADEKSRSALTALSSTTPGHSRKGSGSSIVSSTSTNSFYSTQNSAEAEESNDPIPLYKSYKKALQKSDGIQTHPGDRRFQSEVARARRESQVPPNKTRFLLPKTRSKPRSLAHQRSSSLDSRKNFRSASDPIKKCHIVLESVDLSGSPTGLETYSPLLRPPTFRMRKAGSSQNVEVDTARRSSSRKGSVGSLGVGTRGSLATERRGSLAAERPISPSFSDLLFGKVPSPPSHIADLWEALNSCNDLEDPCGSQSETLWEIWGRIINDFDCVKKRPAFLKELVRKGIPHEFRGMAWQLVLGVHDSPWKQEYREHMKKTSPCEKLIRRDIARTFPEHDFFREKDGFGQESLFNVMKAYSLHDREVGYCQGSGFIVGLLLMQMPEEDAFAVLVRLMQDFRLRELFKPSMAELGLCMYKLECLIQELLPTLLVHFQTQNFDTSMYASSWFLTLYVTSLPLSLARRIMDLFVSEGMEMIFRVGVAILQSCQEDLLALDMEGLLKYLQKDLRSRFEQESDQDNLLQTAYSIKYNHKKMKK
ncbi:Rab GTPase-activating protein 1 [Plakobranchus ocellatus]|uniref:Rab GTPase-activating protein 1 n=1 Tax=Plakobranchus ocellatus TaxID=259542 RepID=A0AAV3YXX8_9GAST|nr:Rab GTPase-activating protein 1 [Plakobranchus ocellatus]